ncbi:MAG: sugar O-acetyltransferase [Erysipelotrichaceae bacterium]|nr:sugar O-acetyltransferase [Erysipelotrichaceae bacterium]
MLNYSHFKSFAINIYMNEKQKMKAGKIYDSLVPELASRRREAQAFCLAYNALPESHPKRARLIKKIFPKAPDSLFVRGPIFVDYGDNVTFGEHVFFNFHAVLLDVCPITIGNNVFFGPNISLLTPMHALIAAERQPYFDVEKGYLTDREYGKPIFIGNDCWFGGNVTILPGVTIVDNVVIGAGSVVTRSILTSGIYAGNPARKIRDIIAEDSIYMNKDLW